MLCLGGSSNFQKRKRVLLIMSSSEILKVLAEALI